MESLVINMYIKENEMLEKLLVTEKKILELGKRKWELSCDESHCRRIYLRNRAVYLRECGQINKLVANGQTKALKNAASR